MTDYTVSGHFTFIVTASTDDNARRAVLNLDGYTIPGTIADDGTVVVLDVEEITLDPTPAPAIPGSLAHRLRTVAKLLRADLAQSETLSKRDRMLFENHLSELRSMIEDYPS